MQVSRFKGLTSPEYRAAVQVLRRLNRDAPMVYADAVHEKIKQEFAQSGRIKERKYGHVCVYRLKGARQCKCYGIRSGNPAYQPIEIPHGDHLSEWTRDGQTVAILSQPYGIYHEAIEETMEFCRAHDLEVRISTYPSFHYPGAVLSVIFTRKGFSFRGT